MIKRRLAYHDFIGIALEGFERSHYYHFGIDKCVYFANNVNLLFSGDDGGGYNLGDQQKTDTNGIRSVLLCDVLLFFVADLIRECSGCGLMRQP